MLWAGDHVPWQWRAATRILVPYSAPIPSRNPPRLHPSPALCVIQNYSCAAACCLHKGLLAALVVLPPPAPPILLQVETSQQRITREFTKHHQGGHNRGPNFGSGSYLALLGRPASPSAGRSAMHGLLRRVFSPSLSGKYSPWGLSESLPLPKSSSPRSRPPVDLGSGHCDPVTLSLRGTLRQLNLLQRDMNIEMSVTITQSATSASAAPKRRLITPLNPAAPVASNLALFGQGQPSQTQNCSDQSQFRLS